MPILATLPFSAWGESVRPTSRQSVRPFELSAVRVLPGPFATAQELDARYLLTLEPDRLLHNFRVNAGLEPKAAVYGGWESQEPDALYVNLFIASEVNWREKRLRLLQLTRFPDEPATKLVVHAAAPTRIRLKIRQPSWCQRATVSLNGSVYVVSQQPGSYVDIDRVWLDGDVVSVELPMRLHLEPLPGGPGIAALMYGPPVLAGRCGTEGLTAGSDLIVNERTYGEVLKMPMELPHLNLSAQTLDEHVTRKASDPLAFAVQTPRREFELIPYYRIAHERYNLYWQCHPEAIRRPARDGPIPG